MDRLAQPVGDVDRLARNALADLNDFWSEAYPEFYGEDFTPLAGGYWSVDTEDLDYDLYPSDTGVGSKIPTMSRPICVRSSARSLSIPCGVERCGLPGWLAVGACGSGAGRAGTLPPCLIGLTILRAPRLAIRGKVNN